jgi:hypothetical protein
MLEGAAVMYVIQPLRYFLAAALGEPSAVAGNVLHDFPPSGGCAWTAATITFYLSYGNVEQK